jgi:hypothetical protein
LERKGGARNITHLFGGDGSAGPLAWQFFSGYPKHEATCGMFGPRFVWSENQAVCAEQSLCPEWHELLVRNDGPS